MNTLTKNDTRALWYAVQAYDDLVSAMRGENFTAEQMAAERAMAVHARRALRKVNAIRKAQGGKHVSPVSQSNPGTPMKGPAS